MLSAEESLRKRVLLLIPSTLKRDVSLAVASDQHPRMDYYALADGLRGAGAEVDLVGYDELGGETSLLVKLAQHAGRDTALAMVGFLRRKRYDAIFTNGENVGIPLALLFKAAHSRPRHVSIGHKPSTGKKRLFFSVLRADRQIDTLFVYSKVQYDFALAILKIPANRLKLFHFHADEHFYHPMPSVSVDPDQICAAGLEWRDYPTLIEAVRGMPDLKVRLAAASPWSKHTDETAKSDLPTNVEARRYEYNELRNLYANSLFVVVPLYENDFQAGITTMLESMAMGKAIIVTATTGQRDVIVDGENGLTVPPGDVAAWRRAIARLREDTNLREELGRRAKSWVDEHATLDRWVNDIVAALAAS